MNPAAAQHLERGTIVGMRYLGATRWARVKAVTALRVYLTTEDLPPFLRPLNLEWVRPLVLGPITVAPKEPT